MGKILSIVEVAYRGTIEEQDDTVLWFSHILKNSGADISILLKGNAVNYVLRGQDASGLSFGTHKTPRSPQIDQDVIKMIEKGIPIYAIEDDAKERGLLESEWIAGIRKIKKAQLPEFLETYEKIWNW